MLVEVRCNACLGLGRSRTVAMKAGMAALLTFRPGRRSVPPASPGRNGDGPSQGQLIQLA